MAAGNGRRILNVERFLKTLRFPFGGYRFRLFPGVDFLSLSGRSRYFPATGSPRLHPILQRFSDAGPLPFRGLIGTTYQEPDLPVRTHHDNHRRLRHHVRQLEALGYRVNVEPVA